MVVKVIEKEMTKDTKVVVDKEAIQGRARVDHRGVSPKEGVGVVVEFSRK